MNWFMYGWLNPSLGPMVVRRIEYASMQSGDAEGEPAMGSSGSYRVELAPAIFYVKQQLLPRFRGQQARINPFDTRCDDF